MRDDRTGEWTTVPMGAASSLKGRLGWQGLKAAHYRDTGPYVVSSAHFEKERIEWDQCPRVTEQRYETDTNIQLRVGDVLLMKDGAALGKIAFVDSLPGPACLNSHLLLFRPINSRYDPSFVYYTLGSRDFQHYIQTHATGLTFLGISQKAISRYTLKLPPLPEQRQIAAVLDTLDDAVRKTEQIIAKLKQVKQGLLHDLLTRGIDDNGELRDPERHPEQFKESALGRIPRGWEVGHLATVADVRSGIAKNSNRAVRGAVEVHYLRVANVQDGFLDLTDMATIPVGRDEVERYAVLPGDVLMNEGGDLDKLGRGSIWRGELSPCVHQNHVFVVRAGAALLPEFLNAWTGSSVARRYFMVAGKQTTNLASINKTALGKLPLVLPSKAEQSDTIRVLSEAERQLSTETSTLSKLGLLKAGLMEDLLTGRVRVTPLLESATP